MVALCTYLLLSSPQSPFSSSSSSCYTNNHRCYYRTHLQTHHLHHQTIITDMPTQSLPSPCHNFRRLYSPRKPRTHEEIIILDTLPVAEAWESTKRIFSNKIWALNLFNTTLFALAVSGYWTLRPQYLESQFRKRATDANFFIGLLSCFPYEFWSSKVYIYLDR